MAAADDDILFIDEEPEGDDLQIFDEVDLKDPSELHQAAADIQTFLKQPSSVRLTILDAQQWEKAVAQYVPKKMRRDFADKSAYFLRDTKRDAFNLLCSPSAVRGINERSPEIYTDFIFYLLRMLDSPLNGPLRKGLDNLLAEACGRQMRVPVRGINATEARLVKGLISILSKEYGYEPIEWARLMRKNPEKFFLALRKTKFVPLWLNKVKEDGVEGTLVDAANKRSALIETLRNEELKMSDPFMRSTLEAVAEHLSSLVAGGKA